MTTERTPGQWISTYKKYVGWIAQEEENWETFAWETLIIRDYLAERWARLSTSEQAVIYATDEQLVQCHHQLSQLLPGGGEHPRAQWWWYLHEGPQVREEAQRATV